LFLPRLLPIGSLENGVNIALDSKINRPTFGFIRYSWASSYYQVSSELTFFHHSLQIQVTNCSTKLCGTFSEDQ
jgi:hypothetical protein